MSSEGFIIFAALFIAVFAGIAFWVVRQHRQGRGGDSDGAGSGGGAAAGGDSARAANGDEAAAVRRREPTFGGKAAIVAAAGGGDSAADGGGGVAAASPQKKLGIEWTPPPLPAPPDALLLVDICFAVYFYSARGAVSPRIFEQLAQKIKRFNLSIYRLLAFNEESGEWQREVSDARRYWILAVPLADRGGQLNKERMSLLEEDVRQFSEEHGLHNRFPPIAEAIANADLLDKFCDAVDLVVEWRINLRAEFGAARIGEILAAHNLTRENDHFVYRLDSETIFQAQCLSTLDNKWAQSLLLILDAPKVSAPEQALDSMAEIARQLNAVFNSTVLDPKGNEVDENRIRAIRGQLVILRKQMNDFGVAPGSSTAHLLFS